MNKHMFKHHQLLRVHTDLEEAWGGAGYGAFNPSSWETETIRCLQSKPAWSMEGVSSQSELHSKTLSQNKIKIKTHKLFSNSEKNVVKHTSVFQNKIIKPRLRPGNTAHLAEFCVARSNMGFHSEHHIAQVWWRTSENSELGRLE